MAAVLYYGHYETFSTGGLHFGIGGALTWLMRVLLRLNCLFLSTLRTFSPVDDKSSS
jgi:hypothetical protein